MNAPKPTIKIGYTIAIRLLVLSTGAVQIIEPHYYDSVLDALLHCNRLNIAANVYGCVYYVDLADIDQLLK